MQNVLPISYYLYLGGVILTIFLIFLSGIASRKFYGAILMLLLTFAGSYVLRLGLGDAYTVAIQNLGRPDPVFNKGKYHVLWGVYDIEKKKVYLVVSGKDEDPKLGMHLYVVDPSDKFLQQLLRELQKKRPFMINVDERQLDDGVIQNSFTFHPEPPPASAPKNN